MIARTVLSLLLFRAFIAAGQAPAISEAAAKDAVYRIVQHSGLIPTFTVREEAHVRTANAYNKGGERIIAYNPEFISRVLDSSRTDWSAVSILAHEIGHHLLGHTISPEVAHPGDELACDRYSGFILQRMGASLEQSLAAMEVAGNAHGTNAHPPKHARLAAIRQGWEDAQALTEHKATTPFTWDHGLTHVVRFVGDANTYYVNDRNELVWFDRLAEPIAFGKLEGSPAPGAAPVLNWQGQRYRVDAGGSLWSTGPNGLDREVGHMRTFQGR